MEQFHEKPELCHFRCGWCAATLIFLSFVTYHPPSHHPQTSPAACTSCGFSILQPLCVLVEFFPSNLRHLCSDTIKLLFVVHFRPFFSLALSMPWSLAGVGCPRSTPWSTRLPRLGSGPPHHSQVRLCGQSQPQNTPPSKTPNYEKSERFYRTWRIALRQ